MIDLVPMTASLVDDAAALLSTAWKEPHPSGCLAWVGDFSTARKRIEAALSGPAVAALQDGQLIGFLAATAPRPPGQNVHIKVGMHATTPENRREIYRRLYGQLAGELTRIGGFTHTITVSSADSDTVTSWFELGFGVDQVKGVRPVRTEPTSVPTGVHVREARPDDLDALADLSIELTRFHAESPMLRPALSDHDFVRDGFLRGMNEALSLVVVTDLGETLGGYLQLNPDHSFVETITIGIASVTRGIRHQGHGTAMINFAMDWASRNGYRFCAVEWTSPNLISDRFWRSHGFQPIQYKLTRRIDSRVAWADSNLSYNYVRPLDL